MCWGAVAFETKADLYGPPSDSRMPASVQGPQFADLERIMVPPVAYRESQFAVTW